MKCRLPADRPAENVDNDMAIGLNKKFNNTKRSPQICSLLQFIFENLDLSPWIYPSPSSLSLSRPPLLPPLYFWGIILRRNLCQDSELLVLLSTYTSRKKYIQNLSIKVVILEPVIIEATL